MRPRRFSGVRDWREPLPHRRTEEGGARERRRRGAALLPKHTQKKLFSI